MRCLIEDVTRLKSVKTIVDYQLTSSDLKEAMQAAKQFLNEKREFIRVTILDDCGKVIDACLWER